jgi:amidase
MKVSRSGCLALCLCVLMSSGAFGADSVAGFTGRWEVTTTYPGGFYVAGLELTMENGEYRGRSGYLVPDGFFYRYTGAVESHRTRDRLRLRILAPDKTMIGELRLRLEGGTLSGEGTLHDVLITVSGRRPLQPPPGAPRVITYAPKVFYRDFAGTNPPALHIFPGDTVRTQTVDAGGGGHDASQHTLPGNPQTGPFYIEGAMIGDTIAVHFNRIRPNRDTAFQYRATILPNVMPPGYSQQPTSGWSDLWKLDRANGTATPMDPSEKLKNFRVELVPMLGCVGVAPYWNQAFATADLGPYGGNMDYNEVREGTTLYLPVYQAGALLTMGDGHALQADGEITGQGFETSMDVEFTVRLIRDQLLDQPWAEDDEYIMVSGIAGSLTQALQIATAGLTNWLKSYYRLNASEIATVLAASMKYDIAEVVDPQVHVVAKIRKQALADIPKPEPPSWMFCQAPWGCDLE